MRERIREIIEDGDRFLITTHIEPDGDAVGSVFSLYWVLSAIGKASNVYLNDPIPYRYRFLPGPERLCNSINGTSYDAAFVLDCGDTKRIGKGAEGLVDKNKLINIDHHKSNGLFGMVNLIDEGASSTAEIMYNIYKGLDYPMSFNVAINLYTGILTDTGSFRYENTNSMAFVICEEMVRLGVKPSYVARMVYENHPKERFRLLGMVLTTIETYHRDRVAIAYITEEMLKKTGTTIEHTDGFAEYIKEMDGIDVAVLIRELDERRCKISMRSKGDIDVAMICSLFGGGGHKNAAGCIIEKGLEETKRLIIEALRF